MLKRMIRQLIFCAGLLPVSLLTMDNSHENFTPESIWRSIDCCCQGQLRMGGRSALQEKINDFRRSTRTQLLIPNLPVIREDNKLCIVNVTIIKTDRAVNELETAITMMSMSSERK